MVKFADITQKEGWSTSESNIQLVLWDRVRLITNRLPASVRSALNAGVKDGRLGHMKKDGYKPEAYYHISFDHLARAARNKVELRIKNTAQSFFTINK